MSESYPQNRNSIGEKAEEPLSPGELEELERLAGLEGHIGKIARKWLESERDD